MIKLKFKNQAFLDLLINQFFLLVFYKKFVTYSKMPQNSSNKYYQDNKERLKEKAHERYQSFSKEEKRKSNNRVVNNTKIY